MTSLHERLLALETRVAELTLALELYVGKRINVKTSPRPTLEQALAMAQNCGVSAEEAEAWWNAREASGWLRGAGNGGILPVGSNHAADLKTWTNSTRQSKSSSNGNHGTNGNGAKSETPWALKTQLEAIETELGRLEEKALYDPLTIADRDLRTRLKTRKQEIRTKLAGL